MRRIFIPGAALLAGAGFAHGASLEPAPPLSDMPALEEVHVWGGIPEETLYKVPATTVSAAELEAINLSSIEDALAYQPSLSVRRRYIGDANGTLGIRGSNPFQTARTLVYVDGLPLHYHLQTRWAGAPRWSLVAPAEVESVDLIYGPFSAAYSGNAMGGVVLINTRTPSESSLRLHGTLFNQHYYRLATEENYGGAHVSASYEDTFGDLTVLAFYNHLENQGQPMRQYYATPLAPDAGATTVEGALLGIDNRGESVIYYGDSGAESSVTDLLKLKAGYDWGGIHLSAALAFEDRNGDVDRPNNFLQTANDAFWDGRARFGDSVFDVDGTHFAVHEQDRQSLLMGFGLSGPLTGNWTFDVKLSQFDLLRDRTQNSHLNPADPSFDTRGRLKEYGDTGWTTLDITSDTEAFAGRDDMSLSLGIHHDHYWLTINNFTLDNWTQYRSRTGERGAAGGDTETLAAFIQYNWQLNPVWDLALGGRYEDWRAFNGFLDGFLDDNHHPDRSTSGFSPKFALGFAPAPDWQLRYSLARALRFPLVEELYQNEDSAAAIQRANAQLAPEDGVHHNLMVEKSVARGFMRINLFHEQIDDTIFNQLGIIEGTEVSTFLAIDEVTTRGAELIVNQPEIWQSAVDLRFNLSYLDAEVTRNRVNPAIEGNDFPRLPHWQSNLLLTYKLNSAVDISGGLRYASDSYGELANTDTATQTFGALDEYLFLNLKADWRLNRHLDLALGMDNVTDAVAYVHHPWPSRTLYLEANYEF